MKEGGEGENCRKLLGTVVLLLFAAVVVLAVRGESRPSAFNTCHPLLTCIGRSAASAAPTTASHLQAQIPVLLIHEPMLEHLHVTTTTIFITFFLTTATTPTTPMIIHL